MPASRFLQALPADLLDTLTPDLERIDLPYGEQLHEAGETIEYVYFPTSSLISMVVGLENGNVVEAATVGNDGFVGIAVLLGMDRADLTATVQVGGEAFRMKIRAFRRLLEDTRFRNSLGEFATKTLMTVGQSTACMAYHSVNERLARWLLVVQAATEQDELPLTQHLLAIMLGVHRPTVTVAVRTLESAGLIDHRRGHIRIIDRKALTEASCECYRLSAWGKLNEA